MRVVSVRQMKQIEENSDRMRVSYEQMMRNAASSAMVAICSEMAVEGLEILVVCGAGNNGGDGYALANLLMQKGGYVTLAWIGEPKSELCRQMAFELHEEIEVIEAPRLLKTPRLLENMDIIVDAIYGTGFHGQVEGPTADILRALNGVSAYRVALDIPSGIAADTAKVGNICFHADMTCVFDSYKIAHLDDATAPFCGKEILCNIGVPGAAYETIDPAIKILDEEWVKSRLVPRDAFSNKGSFGRLLVIAGSAHYSGAAMMATRAATRTGAGLTTLCSTKEVCQSLAGAIPEASKLPLKSDENGFIAFGEEEKLAQALLRAKAVVLGCGLGQTAGARALCQYVLKHAACPVLLDADGINCICADINILKKLATQVVITPHPGEMARMLGTTVEQVQQNRIQSALTFAKEYGVHVVLKGRYTLIVSPQGEMMLNTNGNPGLAKGGSGDVLAGVIGSLLAQGHAPFEAACQGVFLHARAGDIAALEHSQYGMLPTDTIEALCEVLKEFHL